MSKENDVRNVHPMMLDPRSAGLVTRYHTEMRARDQSVGEHSWQLVRLLLCLFPDCPRHILVHAAFHDVAERRTGDLPYPVKAENDDIWTGMDRLERDTRVLMTESWGVPPAVELLPDEKALFKLVEFIEMWEHSLDELCMGNRSAELVRARCISAISPRARELGPDVEKIVWAYISKRTQHVENHFALPGARLTATLSE